MIYTCVDLGSHSIKIVVLERINDKFHVIASTKVRSMGIKKGVIKDKDLALKSLEEAILDINDILGIKIKEVLLSFPLFGLNTTIESADVSVSGLVEGVNIQEVLNKVVSENVPNNLEVVYLEPIVFSLDDDLQVVDPKGLTCDKLEARAAISTIDKKFLYSYLELLGEAGLEVVDITYSLVGDYFNSTNRDISKSLGVVVNFGYGKTEVAIFNKGIMLKGAILPFGSQKIDKDISYIYKVDKQISVNLKEKFAVASSKYSDKNDITEVSTMSGDKININQFEISQVVEARLSEMIKSVKNEINSLTNREISYIIITGGVTNLVGFPYLIDEMFNYDNKIIANITSLGVRSNAFTSSFGLIKYFDNKMKFRDKSFTMISEESKNELTAKKKKGSARESLISKFSEYLRVKED